MHLICVEYTNNSTTNLVSLGLLIAEISALKQTEMIKSTLLLILSMSIILK